MLTSDYSALSGSAGTPASNLSLQNANVTGLAYVGGLTGFNDGSISNVSVSGAIAGSFCIGGLVGQNNTGRRSINNASASGTVTASGSGYAGGLVGGEFRKHLRQFRNGRSLRKRCKYRSLWRPGWVEQR